MENSADPNQTPHSAASDLGLDCLQMHICPNAWGYYGNVYIHVLKLEIVQITTCKRV